MSYSPTGFTDISPTYVALAIPPTTSGEVTQNVGFQAWTSTVEVNQLPEGTTVESPSIRVIPLHDAAVTIVTEMYRSYYTEESIDLFPSSLMPTGSSGPAIYASLGLPSPNSASLHNSTPSNAIQSLLGSLVKQVNTLESWVIKVLQLVHSDKSVANSEVNTLLQLMPTSVRTGIGRYVSLLNEAGKMVTDTTRALQADYAYGNTVVNNNAVHQHNVGQARFNTASIFSVNSPATLFSSQQIVTQTRFNHTTADLYQGSFQHHFTRAEDQWVAMGGNLSLYSQDQMAIAAANLAVNTGSCNLYSDVLNLQVGQASATPLHPTRSNSATNYGTLSANIQKDALFQTNLGRLATTSALNTDVVAKTIALNLACLSGPVNISGVGGSINLFSDTGVGFSSGGPVIGTGTSVSLASSSVLILRGSPTFINCGPRQSTVTTVTPPTPLSMTPQTIQAMTDVAPYPKTSPVTPQPASQVSPLTPSVPDPKAGSQNLGTFLTGGSR